VRADLILALVCFLGNLMLEYSFCAEQTHQLKMKRLRFSIVLCGSGMVKHAAELIIE